MSALTEARYRLGFSTYYAVEVGRIRAALSPEAASEVARG